MRKHKKGFTIVELVIVIAVIGILSAILIPTFINVTDNANKAALQSDLSTSYSMYAAEAADRVVGETETEIVFKAQAEVELSKEVTENNAQVTKIYHFDEANRKWVPNELEPNKANAYVVTINKTDNEGKYVVVEGKYVVDPDKSAEQSTFGGYTFQYYKEA